MSDEQMAPETRGVAVELLATVDLGPEIQGMEGRQLRMRMVTIEPGGVFGPVHDHEGRPGTVYVLQGTITDHRDGIATDYGPGVGWPEDRNTLHWLENRGTVPAVEISVDVVQARVAASGRSNGQGQGGLRRLGDQVNPDVPLPAAGCASLMPVSGSRGLVAEIYPGWASRHAPGVQGPSSCPLASQVVVRWLSPHLSSGGFRAPPLYPPDGGRVTSAHVRAPAAFVILRCGRARGGTMAP